MQNPLENLFDALDRISNTRDLPFLLVGGHAVNAYGYLRTTYDVDVAVSDNHASLWRRELEAMGYEMFFGTDAFLRFRGKEKQDAFPVDLMLVAPTTFEKLRRDSRMRKIGKHLLPIVSPLHLMAMKLHALHQPRRAADGKDLNDIVALIKGGIINVQTPDFRAIIEKYGDKTTRARLSRFYPENQ